MKYIATAATGHEHSQPSIQATKKPGPGPSARRVEMPDTMKDANPVVSIANISGRQRAGSFAIIRLTG